MASETYHEPYQSLSPPTRDHHRAIVSLMEELEAIDWYQQRAEACEDAELRAVLLHNKEEEIEHAMMVLEWLRRNHVEFDKNIRTYLLTQGPITEIEKRNGVGGAAAGAGSAGSAASGGGAGSAASAGSAAGLGIGSLKGA